MINKTVISFCIVFLINLITSVHSNNSSYKKPVITTRIFGAKYARPGQFPYQVSLISTVVNDEFFDMFNVYSRCSGSLIHPEWVLTAAHCLYLLRVKRINGEIQKYGKFSVFVKKIKIFVGSIREQNQKESGYQEFIVTPKNYYVHKKFRRQNITHNDIGLVKLPRPAELNQFVQLIKLPNRKFTHTELENKTIITTGWGRNEHNRGGTILKYAKFYVLNTLWCKTSFPGFNEDYQICQFSRTSSVCEGDSGGPSVMKDSSGTSIQIGLTSFGVLACSHYDPQILTSVSAYIDWIELTTGLLFS